MNNHTLYQEYLQEGTAGFAIIRRFYSRYADLLSKAHFVHIDDVVHEVFVSLSKTDFQQVRNVEHYLMRAIKLHCWSLLDKAMRIKAVIVENPSAVDTDEQEPGAVRKIYAIGREDHLIELEGMELLAKVNLFKTRLDSADARLLNLLIDGTNRSEIAEQFGLNMNTLDTNIRRLRVKLADYLRSIGYTYKVLERFN